MQVQKKNRVLLHACCAICSGYPISLLKDMGYEPVVFFYNPNIYPKEEYLKRLDAEKTLCKYHNVDLIEGEYEPEVFFDRVRGFENEPERGARCDLCFAIRLEKTAQKAKELGIDEFTTSIVISPHKNYERITKIGQNIAQKTDLKYLAIDFKKKDGFLKTNKLSKELGLYRQNYCGCKFSIREN